MVGRNMAEMTLETVWCCSSAKNGGIVSLCFYDFPLNEALLYINIIGQGVFWFTCFDFRFKTVCGCGYVARGRGFQAEDTEVE